MNKLSQTINKYCFWTKAYKKRKSAKNKIKTLKSLTFEVVLKQWEHQSWGDSIHIEENMRVYGHISGVRYLSGYNMLYCDIENGDILIYEIAESQRHLVNGDAYVVGYLTNIDKHLDPKDMFFADFKTLFTASDVSDVRHLVENEIKRLEQYI